MAADSPIRDFLYHVYDDRCAVLVCSFAVHYKQSKKCIKPYVVEIILFHIGFVFYLNLFVQRILRNPVGFLNNDRIIKKLQKQIKRNNIIAFASALGMPLYAVFLSLCA